MSSITGVTAEPFKKSASFFDGNKYNHKNVDKISKVPSLKKENKEVFCNYCKNKGHMKADCFKLKRKEQSAHHHSTTASPSIAVAATEISKDESNVIASVCKDSSLKFKISDPIANVNSINDNSCSLLALIDTGSTVSFIRLSTFKTLFDGKSKLNEPSYQSYKTLANDRIPVIGAIDFNITLVSLPEMNATIKFQVVNIEAWSTHLILGRDFLRDNKLHLIYNPSSSESNKLDLLDQVASTEILELIYDY